LSEVSMMDKETSLPGRNGTVGACLTMARVSVVMVSQRMFFSVYGVVMMAHNT
jgi:hypothetical protein